MISKSIPRGSEGLQTTGVRAVKIEPDIDLPINIDQRQSINLLYNIEEIKDTAQIGRVSGDRIKINYPVKDVSHFNHLKFIESQFSKINSAEIDEELIDKTICELISYYLKLEGVKLPGDPKDAARAKCLMLKQVRGIKSDEKVVSYLNDKSYLTQLFGARADCIDASASTYSGVRDQYEMDRQAVRNAVHRIQHMLYRNGALQNTLSDAGYIPGQAIPQGQKIPPQLRDQALINWSDLLLEQLTDGISFGRFRKKYSVREIIASVANIAIEKNTEKRQNLARLRYNDDIITIGQIRNIIYENIAQKNFLTSKQNLEHITTELHRNLFKFASEELGFFSQPLDIAIDPTWISLEKELDPNKVSGAMGNIQLEGDSGYKFATGVSFRPMSRFSLGVSLVTDKSALADIYRRMILMLEEFTNIGWILADREFDDPETIEFARSKSKNTWIIRLRDHKKVIDKKEYENLKNNGKDNISIGDIEVNTFYKQIQDQDLNRVLTKPDDDNKLILMSGQPLNETNITNIIRKYSKRWSAETYIRQLKHDFSPQIPGRYAFDYLFFLNISSIFYNINKIINQSLSPMYGLPLRPRSYEVLAALVRSTFQSRCCCCCQNKLTNFDV